MHVRYVCVWVGAAIHTMRPVDKTNKVIISQSRHLAISIDEGSNDPVSGNYNAQWK